MRRSHGTEDASKGKASSDRGKKDVALVFASSVLLSKNALNDLIGHDLAPLFAQPLISSGFTAKHFQYWKSKATPEGAAKETK